MELEYLTLKLAHDLTGLSESTLRRRVAEGEIPRANWSLGKILIPKSFFTSRSLKLVDNNKED